MVVSMAGEFVACNKFDRASSFKWEMFRQVVAGLRWKVLLLWKNFGDCVSV